MSLYLFVNGRSWVVERRREDDTGRPSGNPGRQKLFLFFSSSDGEIRRSDIAENFPDEPQARLLESVWKYAEVVRAGDPGEMTTRGELVMPRMRDIARQFARAFLLRCPNCGARKLSKHWFVLVSQCPSCGMRIDRGEADDNLLGGMLFNITLAELLFALVLLLVMTVMWPNVPWAGVEYTLVIAMIAAPIILYPVSRLMWLALDLLLRPPDATEMAWHAATRDRTGPRNR
ncbi:MAG: DUF983 domain-containing protein [Gemmatimonadales bacterium]